MERRRQNNTDRVGSQGTMGNIISKKERAEKGQISRSNKIGQCYQEVFIQRQKGLEFSHKVMSLRNMQSLTGRAQHLAELYLETNFSSLYISSDCRIRSHVFGNVSEKMIPSVFQIIFINRNI